MKYFFIMFFMVSNFAFCEVKEYENSYKNVEVGVTPIHVMINELGNPREISDYSDNIFYLYRDMKITALKSSGLVSRIIVYDKSYVDSNGISIGFSRNFLETVLNVKISKGVYTDKSKGIIYWLDGDKVQKIVLIHKLKSS